jgi:hypothetical protein
MAYGNMTPAVLGAPGSSAANNQIITNVEDLDTRLDVTEALTTNTSGTVGLGNQRLSDRLGAGVTTAATADARFGSGVGIGSNVTTGSATSQLVDVRGRILALETAPAPTSGPLGWKGQTNRNALDTVGATETVGESLTVALTTARRYKLTWDFVYDCSTAASPYPFFRVRISAAAGSVTNTSTLLFESNLNAVSVGTSAGIINTFTVASSATYQIGCFLVRSSGTVSIRTGNPRILLVEDIGPV